MARLCTCSHKQSAHCRRSSLCERANCGCPGLALGNVDEQTRRGASSRRLILSLVDEQPGIPRSRIGPVLGLTTQLVHYHLRILKDRSQVTLDGGIRDPACYLRSAPASLRSNPRTRAVLGVLERLGPLPLAELANSLGWTRLKTSRVVLDELQRGSLIGTSPKHGGRGRPARVIRLPPGYRSAADEGEAIQAMAPACL